MAAGENESSVDAAIKANGTEAVIAKFHAGTDANGCGLYYMSGSKNAFSHAKIKLFYLPWGHAS